MFYNHVYKKKCLAQSNLIHLVFLLKETIYRGKLDTVRALYKVPGRQVFGLVVKMHLGDVHPILKCLVLSPSFSSDAGFLPLVPWEVAVMTQVDLFFPHMQQKWI